MGCATRTHLQLLGDGVDPEVLGVQLRVACPAAVPEAVGGGLGKQRPQPGQVLLRGAKAVTFPFAFDPSICQFLNLHG